MVLHDSINDREMAKFEECEGNHAVRTTLCGSASFTPSGLTIGGLVTEVNLDSSTWTALPPTPLTGRNAVGVQNLSGISIKINHSSGVGGWVGILVKPNGERYYDITDSVIVYAKAESGTPTIVVEEIA